MTCVSQVRHNYAKFAALVTLITILTKIEPKTTGLYKNVGTGGLADLSLITHNVMIAIASAEFELTL